LASIEQQVQQIGLGQIEQSGQGFGAGWLQGFALPLQKTPNQQIVLEQAAPRPPAKPPQLLGPDSLVCRWFARSILLHRFTLPLKPLAAPAAL
jgi:hypothetical protein